jgi:heptosyltransferase-2
MEYLIEGLTQLSPTNSGIPSSPNSILVLRNNDLGDLLIVTPLFQALKEHFPNAKLAVATGPWCRGILDNNPYVDEIIYLNAPWHNHYLNCQSVTRALGYIALSKEVEQLQKQHFDIGIDIVGSAFGSLLFLKSKIPYRLGVKGFAGGHTACQQYVMFNPAQQVGRAALHFAELLGQTILPQAIPQIYLSNKEQNYGQKLWIDNNKNGESQEFSKIGKIVIAPGGGFSTKLWEPENFTKLAHFLFSNYADKIQLLFIGNAKENALCQLIIDAVSEQAPNANVCNLAGKLSLRDTFGLLSFSDLVITNSSMVLHASQAFSKKTVTVLGSFFPSKAEHDATWGYEKNYYSAATLAEAQEIVRQLLPEISS